jgi:hypothetical protein
VARKRLAGWVEMASRNGRREAPPSL